MKYLKYLLGILAVLVICFLLIGFIKSEVSYECEIVVNKPMAESWSVIQDESKMSEWLPGFQRIEHISGTPGEVGSVANVYFETDGQLMMIEETITEIIPNESTSMSYISDFMNMDYTMKMNSVSEGTKISTWTSAKGNGVFARSMMALVGGSIKAQEDTNLTNLKRTIEENKKSYAPAE